MKTLFTTVITLALAGSALAYQQSAKAEKTAKMDDAAIIAQQLPSYPLDKCPISGESLAGEEAPVDLVYEGRLVRFCCKSCVKKFKEEPAKVLAQVDAAVIKEQLPSYPLTECPVSGEKLGGDMGDPIDYVYGTRLVRFCCKSCVKGFLKDPAATMAKVDAALIADQLKSYPLNTCLVSGNAIEGDGTNVLHGTRLVRFCCPKCPGAFKKDPAKYLAKLDEAGKAKAKQKQGQ